MSNEQDGRAKAKKPSKPRVVKSFMAGITRIPL